MTLIQTEDQAEAEVRLFRLRQALNDAPDVASHVRSLVVTGKPERGETLPEWSAPMRVSAQDDLDSFYSQILDWVSWWAQELNSFPPSSSATWLRGDGEVQGFRSVVSVEGVAILTQLNTGWLMLNSQRIHEHPQAREFEEDIIRLVYTMRSRYGLVERSTPPVSARPCPLCNLSRVRIDFAVGGVYVVCGYCGYEVPANKSFKEVLLWLE